MKGGGLFERRLTLREVASRHVGHIVIVELARCSAMLRNWDGFMKYTVEKQKQQQEANLMSQDTHAMEEEEPSPGRTPTGLDEEAEGAEEKGLEEAGLEEADGAEEKESDEEPFHMDVQGEMVAQGPSLRQQEDVKEDQQVEKAAGPSLRQQIVLRLQNRLAEYKRKGQGKDKSKSKQGTGKNQPGKSKAKRKQGEGKGQGSGGASGGAKRQLKICNTDATAADTIFYPARRLRLRHKTNIVE